MIAILLAHFIRPYSYNISGIVSFFLEFLLAIGNLGWSLDRITFVISALGVGIGFSLQNIAKDVVSGALLLVERPMRVGDWVEVENLLGVVTHIGIRFI